MASGLAGHANSDGEIARSAQDASSSTDRVVSRIAKVHESTRESDAVTKNLTEAAGNLNSQSDRLRQDTEAFLSSFHAAQ